MYIILCALSLFLFLKNKNLFLKDSKNFNTGNDVLLLSLYDTKAETWVFYFRSVLVVYRGKKVVYLIIAKKQKNNVCQSSFVY